MIGIAFIERHKKEICEKVKFTYKIIIEKINNNNNNILTARKQIFIAFQTFVIVDKLD